MSLAIGATNATSAISSSGSGSTVALQAQLDRCVSQLGDWTSCSSGKTPEGQKIIAALEQKIGSLKTQIQTVNSNSGKSTSSKSGTPNVTPPASLALASIGNLGTLLNVVA